MSLTLPLYFSIALGHKKEHKCGGVPYEHGDMLSVLVQATHPKRILELGTGIGYSTACLASASKDVSIDTIEQHQVHLDLAQKYWTEMGLEKRIKTFCDKAEAILPELTGEYDFIFFDGYDPSLKFLIQYEKLLKKGGLLITANLFLKDSQGGKYLRHLMDERKWSTGVFSDTSISVKKF